MRFSAPTKWQCYKMRMHTLNFKNPNVVRQQSTSLNAPQHHKRGWYIT